MSRPILRLVPIAPRPGDLDLLAWLGAALTQRTGLVTIQGSPLPIPGLWWDVSAGALSSSAVVDTLIDSFPEDVGDGREWTLAITSEDLAAPGRPYVFGEATLGGSWAVISSCRLSSPEELDDESRARERLLKEAIHEVGHLADLPHCARPRCVMAKSAAVESLDRKLADFCEECRVRFDALVEGAGAP